MMGQSPLAFVAQKLGGTAVTPGQLGKQSELWMGQRHGQYYAGAYGGLGGYVCNQSAVTLVALGATSYTGLAVQNPATSGVNLVVNRIFATQSVISAAVQTIALMNGKGTFTPSDSLTPASTILAEGVATGNAANLKAVVTAAATLAATQVLICPLGATGAAVGTYSVNASFDGVIIVPPGDYIGICDPVGTPTASAVLAAIFWEEVPV
jgi:hypothetical protein